jgi:hypothetical protein
MNHTDCIYFENLFLDYYNLSHGNNNSHFIIVIYDMISAIIHHFKVYYKVILERRKIYQSGDLRHPRSVSIFLWIIIFNLVQNITSYIKIIKCYQFNIQYCFNIKKSLCSEVMGST